VRQTEEDPLFRLVLARIHKDLQTSLVVLGSYTIVDDAAGPQLRFDLQVQDCRTGNIVSSVAEKGPEGKVFELVADAGKRLRDQLTPDERTPADATTVRAALPTSVQAARQYAEGLAQLRAGNAMAARDLLQSALATDDKYALSHLALAQAWANLGYDSRAQAEAQRALALAAPLTREQQLWIEAFYHGAGYDWPNAIKTYQLLFDFYPDNLEYGLALAETQIRGGRMDAALETLNQLRKLGAHVQDDPRVDIVRAQAFVARGELQKAADSATQAAANARTRGAELLVASAEIQAARSYRRLGQCDKVKDLEVDGERIFSRASDRKGITQLKNELALCLRLHGDEAGALALFQEILKTCEQLGAHECTADANYNCAVTLGARSRYEDARAYYERAVAIYREINDRPSLGHSLVNIAVLHLGQGNVLEARRMVEEGIDILRGTNVRPFFCEARMTAAYILTEFGDLAGAHRMYDGNAALARELGDKRILANFEHSYAQLLFYAGKLDAARSAYAEARRRYLDLGDVFWPVFTEIGIALINIEEDKPKAAEASARAAVERLEKLAPDEMRVGIPTARQVLARSLLLQGQTRAARAELDRALAIHVDLDFSYRELLSITQARVLAAEGHGEAALELLERVRAEAARGHYAPIELEARRAALELRAAARPLRRPDASIRADARVLTDEAAKLGFGLIAKKMEPLITGQ
jgi:tetratricopeptide (TPR) repeat protein